ncbi:MAG TPA: hypothetical protein VHE79_01220 [Spirochaetia bacterium]
MSDSYYAIESMMRERQRAILGEAAAARRAREAVRSTRDGATLAVRLMARVGALLVTAGRRMEERAARRGACVDCGSPALRTPAAG